VIGRNLVAKLCLLLECVLGLNFCNEINVELCRNIMKYHARNVLGTCGVQHVPNIVSMQT
jgi:hypothetical protein